MVESKTPNTPLDREHLRSIHSEVHSSKCRLGQSDTSKRRGNSRSFNNMIYQDTFLTRSHAVILGTYLPFSLLAIHRTELCSKIASFVISNSNSMFCVCIVWYSNGMNAVVYQFWLWYLPQAAMMYTQSGKKISVWLISPDRP